MSFRHMALVLGVGLALGAPASQTIAHGFIIDQECPEGYAHGHSFRNEEPVGQEFVPQMSSLDVVELVVGNTGGVTATVAIRIRFHTIFGPVVATSNPLILPHPTTRSWQHLDFASPVALVPGELYVIEFVDLTGLGNAVAWGAYNSYAPGRAVFGDLFDDMSDFSFREGPMSPVPVEPTTWGSVKALYR